MSKFPLPVVLGSSSKSRRSILASHGFEFAIDKPEIHEKGVAPDLVCDPSAYALAVSQAKMDALLPKYTPENPVILITSDQVVSWHNKVREKPVDAEVDQQLCFGLELHMLISWLITRNVAVISKDMLTRPPRHIPPWSL